MSNLVNSNNVSEDIQMGAPRGRSTITSMNISRKLSIYSNTYIAHIKAQNNNPNWANQMEAELFQLFYATPKKGETNIQVLANNQTSKSISHAGIANNMFSQLHIFNIIIITLCGASTRQSRLVGWPYQSNFYVWTQ